MQIRMSLVCSRTFVHSYFRTQLSVEGFQPTEGELAGEGTVSCVGLVWVPHRDLGDRGGPQDFLRAG